MFWLTELAWAIELHVMYERWLDERELTPATYDEMYFRTTWVRMCMRLGDGAAYRIVRHSGSGRAVLI